MSSSEHAESHRHKHKKHNHDDKTSSTRPEKLDRHSDKSVQTARQLKLIQKWSSIIQTLKEADQLSPEEGVKQFDEAMEKIDNVKREKEKLYLLEIGLPEMMLVVLETQYLVEAFHKKINNLVQKALTFALDSFDVSLAGACKLMKDIFCHRYFEAVFSEGIIMDQNAAQTSNRDFLSTSRRIKTLRRLNDALTTFCDQKGYVQLHAYLARPHQPLDETRHLLQVVVTMANYLNTTSATLMQFIREGNARLLELAGGLLAHELPLYAEIKMLIHQLLDMVQSAEIGLTQEIWKLSVVAKLAKDIPQTLPVLLMRYPEKSSRIISLDPTKLQVIRDAKQEFCRQTELENDEVVLNRVVNGTIIKMFDDSHSITSMFVQSSFNVAYQTPIGWKRKYVQAMITESKNRPEFIPFFVYLRRKDLNGKHLYENVIPSSFLFTVKSMAETPFSLKGLHGAEIVDISPQPQRIFPELLKGESVTIRVYWAESAESSPIQHNELLTSKQASAKRDLVDALTTLLPQADALRACLCKAKDQAHCLATEVATLQVSSSNKNGKKGNIVLDMIELDGKEHKHSNKHISASSKINFSTAPAGEYESAMTTISTCDSFFEGLSLLISSCDLDISNAAVQLFHAFSGDTMMRDLLGAYTPVPKLAKNLLSPSLEVRRWSSLALTNFGYDSFFYQRPIETFETFEVRTSAPNHLNHHDSEVLQFLYQVNSLRTVDPEFIEHATTEQLFWFLPLVFQTLQTSRILREGSHAVSTLRFTLHLLLEKLQPLSYLRQFTLWLLECNLIDRKEFEMEWAIGTRFVATRAFFSSLATLMPMNIEIGKKYTGLDILDPMHDVDGHNLPIAAVTVLKVFSSKAKPCLLELFPSDSKYPSRRVIFKKGDDLRQDLLVQACFYLFNMLWTQSDLDDKPFIHQYRLIPMGPDIGCVEFVNDSESLQTFSFENAWPKFSEEDKSTLLRSAAGSYVAGWVMGVRDRHQDNMMIQHGNKFFHIDLGHIFNEKPTIDAPRFSIPDDLKQSMTPEEWVRFKDLCANGFKILHRHAGMLINLICLMFRGVVIDMPKTRLFLSSPQSLMVALDEKDATDKIRNMIESGVTSVKKRGKYLIHTIFVGNPPKSNGSAGSSASASRQTEAIFLQGGPDSMDDPTSEPTCSRALSSTGSQEMEDSANLSTPRKSARSSGHVSPRSAPNSSVEPE